MKTRRIGDIPTAEDLTGAQIAAIRRDVAALQQNAAQQSAIVVGVPQPFQPFTVLYEEIKSQVWAFLPIAIPSEIDELTQVIIKASDSTSQAAYSENKLTFEITDIDENEKEAGFIQRKFGHKLEYDTEYLLTRLIGNPGKLKNPEAAPKFDDPPLATFRTPILFGSPSRPHLGNILENEFNQETESWDAFVVVQVIAPASATANATGTVAIADGSNIITGTGTSFLTEAAVGRGVTVNGETHIVTAVTDNTHITVDHPFRQTIGGQTMAVLTLMTWGEAKAERVTPKFRLVDDPNQEPINDGHHFSEDEFGLTSISFRVNKFLAGRGYEWVRTVLSGQGESKDITALTPQIFIAGGFANATPGIPEISLDFIFESKDPQDGKNVGVKAKITQPSPPVALESLDLQIRIAGTGTVSITTGSPIITGSGTSFLSDVDESNLIIVGAQTFTVLSVDSNTQITAEENSNASAAGQSWTLARVKQSRRIRKAKFHPLAGGTTKPVDFGNVKTKKLLSQTFVIVVTAVNGQQKVVQENFATGDVPDGGAAVPGALAFPSAPTGANNTVDGDPDKNLAIIGITLATSNGQTFASNNISKIEVILVRRNAANSADVGEPFTEVKALRAADLAASSVIHQFYHRMGNRLRILEVVARNGDKRTSTTGSADFIAGGVVFVDPADALTVPAPTFGTITRLDGSNKEDEVPVTVSQNGSSIILYKYLQLRKSTNGGAFKEEEKLGLISEDTLYLSPSASKTFSLTVKRKAGVTVQYQAFVVAKGGKASATTTSGTQAATGADVPADPNVPTLAFPSAPAVEDWFGTIHVSCPSPTANLNTSLTWQVIMSTSSVAPIGSPTVGSEGVVKIRPDQHVTFRPKQKQTDNLYFYYRVRNESFPLFTAWSTGTLLTPDGVARPLDDVIGTGPPLLPQALERSATSGTGHTLTTFVLDAGASSQDDFYNGQTLYVTSESADDQIRVVLDYVGATRTCTVAAFASAPIGAVAYELHRGQTRAANSGTGHTLTTFILDSGASTSNDAYNGQTLYIPSLPSGDRVRRVLDYVGATRAITVETSFGATPVGVKGFVLFPGTLGFANSDQTGIASGSPLRVYLDTDTNQNVVELILPTGENAFSLTQAQVQVVRLNNGAIKFDQKLTLSATTVFTFNAPSAYTPVIRVRFRNLFRESGSDGWSAWSSWVAGFRSTDTPNIIYSPGELPPIEVDFQDSGNYPGSRYGAY